MKLRLNSVLAPVTALAVSWSFIACEKKQEEPAKPASSEAPAKPEAPKSGDTKPAASTEPVKAPPAPEAAPAVAADIAKLREQYGFAARITKDSEGFAAAYRLGDLWRSIEASKWVTALLEIPAIKADTSFQRGLDNWKTDPDTQLGRDIADAFLGGEMFLIESPGFTDRAVKFLDVQQDVQMAQIQGFLTGGMSAAGRFQAMQRALKDNSAEILPKVAMLEMPPIIVGFKAGRVREKVDGFLKKGLEQLMASVPPGLETGAFKLDGKHEFQTLNIIARKVVPQFQEANMQLQFKEMLGDEAKAKQLSDALMSKRLEIAWGWVDDYFIVSFGTDHSHLKFAASDADSILTVPELAARAAAFAGKKPNLIGYVSKAMFDKINTPIEFAGLFKEATAAIAGILPEDAIAGMNNEVTSFQAKVQDLFKSETSSQISIGYVDGGLRLDTLGGLKAAGMPAPRPLGLSGIFSPQTLLFLNLREDKAQTAKMNQLVEEGVGMVWGWYNKFGKTMVPEDGRQGAAMMESMAVPMVKRLWTSYLALDKALGDEVAITLDLDGPFPPFPGVPKPVVEQGKAPRLALAFPLRDRAALAESWKGFSMLIDQAIALTPALATAEIPKPQTESKDGTEFHYYPLPMPLGTDLLPHAAITKDRLILSTSRGLSSQIATTAAGNGPATHIDARINLPALWDAANKWLDLAANNKEAFFEGNASAIAEFEKNKPLIEVGLKLARSFKGFSIEVGEEGGKPHGVFSILAEDLK